MHRLSLLVPARNAARTLPRLFESAAQDGGFDEVIVYDDASTDDTGAVARAHGANIIRSEINTGPSAGKNRLAREPACGWLHFHDADDALAPGFVARLRHWMHQPAIDVVVFAAEDRDDETSAVLGQARWDDDALRRDPVRYHLEHTVTNCALHRREAFLDAGGFDTDPAVKYNEDQAMHIRMALAGLRYRADDFTGGIHYRRRGSMSSGHPIECVRSQVEVLARAAVRTGRRYREEIGARVWRLAGAAGGFEDWAYVERCLQIAEATGYHHPRQEAWLVRAMARVDPASAIRVREALIRFFKPHLRDGMPTASAMGVPQS